MKLPKIDWYMAMLFLLLGMIIFASVMATKYKGEKVRHGAPYAEIPAYYESKAFLPHSSFGYSEIDTLKRYCKKYRVPAKLTLIIIWTESRFDSTAVNKKTGCWGYMQLSPKYFASGNRFDNLRQGVKFLSDCYEKYHKWRPAIAYYGGGGGMAYNYADRIIKKMGK